MVFDRRKLAAEVRDYLGGHLVDHDEWGSRFNYSQYPSSSPFAGPRFQVGHYNGGSAQLPRINADAAIHGAEEAEAIQMRYVDRIHFVGNGWDHGFAYLFGIGALTGLIYEGRSFWYPHGAHHNDPLRLDVPVYQMLGLNDPAMTVKQIEGHDRLWRMFHDLIALPREAQRGHREVQGWTTTRCPGPLYLDLIHRHKETPVMPVVRIAGVNRYETAAAVSVFKSSGAPVDVAVASGVSFADATAASTLDVPVLLTDPLNLPPATAAEITRLAAKNVVVIGGPDAVSDAVFAEISNLV